MAKTSFVKHHVRKYHYYVMMFTVGYLIGFLNGFFSQNLAFAQAVTNPSTFIYAIGMTLTTVLAFEIGRNVK